MKQTLLFLGLFALFSLPAFADDDTGTDIVDRADYDPNTPYYQIMPPGWGLGARVAISKFPSNATDASIYEFFAEKQLHWQKIGVFSAGIDLGMAQFFSSGNNLIKWGLIGRYQLHVMKNQILVPTIAFVYDSYHYSGATTHSAGIMVGGMLNLGFFDPTTARDSHNSIGLLRTYLTAEVRPSVSLTSNAGTFPVGSIWSFGVRLEFE